METVHCMQEHIIVARPKALAEGIFVLHFTQ